MMHMTGITGMRWPRPVIMILSMEGHALVPAREEVTWLACNDFSLADGDGILKVHHCLLPVRASASAMCLPRCQPLPQSDKWTEHALAAKTPRTVVFSDGLKVVCQSDALGMVQGHQ